MSYNLNLIFEKIAAETIHEEDCRFSVKELWKWVVFDAENSVLNDSLTIHGPSGFAIKGRATELEKTLQIKGDFLLFDFIGHAPSYRLIALESAQDIANLVLSHSGIFNSFTTIQIPVIKGEICSLKALIELIDKGELEESLSTQELIHDFQKIIQTGIRDNTFNEKIKEARNCIIKYKEKGISQQQAYDIVFVIKMTYRALEINYLDDFIDEVLDYICGYIGNKELWIWDKPLSFKKD